MYYSLESGVGMVSCGLELMGPEKKLLNSELHLVTRKLISVDKKKMGGGAVEKRERTYVNAS